jgi:hypothetical protein
MFHDLIDFLRHLPLPVVVIVYFLICGLVMHGFKAMDTELHELLIHGDLSYVAAVPA